jgi:hypothetical protein
LFYKIWSLSGLPDGLFSSQKFQFGYILEGLRLENVDMFYGHLKYFMTIWYNLCSLVHFFGFGIVHQEKSGNPGVFSLSFGGQIANHRNCMKSIKVSANRSYTRTRLRQK